MGVRLGAGTMARRLFQFKQQLATDTICGNYNTNTIGLDPTPTNSGVRYGTAAAVCRKSRVWNSLRNGPKKNAADAATTILRRIAGSEQFQQSEFNAFLHATQEAGIALLPIDEFATRYSAYYDAQPQAAKRKDARFGHIKFDIHGDIARPVEMARILNRAGVHGLFLIMHRHALNDSWYGSAQMWNALKEIRDLGHEIGLHADPFHLITTYNDLYTGLESALAEFRAQGYPMRAMTLHGDSRPHIKARKLQANDFFADEFRKSKWDGIAPEGQEVLAEHVRQYKHRRLYRKLGIEYVADVNLVKEGKLIVRESMMYLSDNQRRLRIGHVQKRIVPSGTLEAPELFSISPEFIAQAVPVLVRRPFLALFHPQWFK